MYMQACLLFPLVFIFDIFSHFVVLGSFVFFCFTFASMALLLFFFVFAGVVGHLRPFAHGHDPFCLFSYLKGASTSV